MSPKKFFIVFWIGTLVSLVNAACNSPWISYESNCYLLYNVSSVSPGHTWNDSRLICRRYGGDLVKLDTDNETAFISSFFQDPKVKYNHYWIGLNDAKNESVFKWADGSDLTVAPNWKISDGVTENTGERKDCVETTFDGKWNVNECFRSFGFICEKGKDAIAPPKPSLPPFPTADKPTTCEAGWIPWGSSCYNIMTQLPETWSDARDDCQRRYADLMIIDGQEEQDFITDKIASLKIDLGLWIGLNDKYFEKRFLWVNGVDLRKTNFTNWLKGEPSNSFGNEDCVEVHGKLAPGKWNDNYCSSLRNYICEKKAGAHTCPNDWSLYNGYCYKVAAHPGMKTSWSLARKKCLDYNKDWRQDGDFARADLVSITSTAEQRMLQKLFRDLNATTANYWIGLTNQNSSGFYWTDGTYYDYTNMRSGFSGNKSCVKSSVSFNSSEGTWVKARCNESNNYVCKLEVTGQDWCRIPVGIQSFVIPNKAMTTNSKMNPATPAEAGRLYLKAGSSLNGAWCAKNEAKSKKYLQIDLGEPQKLTYMGFQGQSNSAAMVLSFYLKYSQDGKIWDKYGYRPPVEFTLFRANIAERVDNETVIYRKLESPLVARYIRIYPTKWVVAPCMRVEFYGCEQGSPIFQNQRGRSRKCGPNWIEDKQTKNCYRLHFQQTTYDSAQETCMTQRANLVSITTNTEKAFINNQLRKFRRSSLNFWIGLNDLDYEGVYRWVDGSPYQLTNWNYGYARRYSRGKLQNCVYISTENWDWDAWREGNCSDFKSFICKRHYDTPYKKEEFNNYFYSKADYFWPFNSATDFEGSLPVQAFGNFSRGDFPVNYTGAILRHTLEISGKSSYMKIDATSDVCLSNPDSGSCTRGITVLFVFKDMVAASSMTALQEHILLDTMGNNVNALGYRVSLINYQVQVALRSRLRRYEVKASYKRNAFNHLAFTWSRNDGLKFYLNGLFSKSDIFGMVNQGSLEKRNTVSDLYIGKSANAHKYTTFAIRSLAIFKKVLKQESIQSSYAEEFGSCKGTQIAHGSYCYSFQSSARSWSSASLACRENGGDLISIHSPVEQAFFSLKVGKYGYNRRFYIGLQKSSSYYSNYYHWSDGSQLQFTFWDAYQPSYYYSYWSSRCIRSTSSGFWNTGYCYSNIPYVCKYPRAIAGAVKKTSGSIYTVQIYSYGPRSLSCYGGGNILIHRATYGSSTYGCYLPIAETTARVKQACSGQYCSLRATDSFFSYRNPCPDIPLYDYSKMLNVTYSCTRTTSGLADRSTRYCSNGGNSDNPYTTFGDNNSCYKFYPQPKTLQEAQKTCEKDNGGLAKINSRDIQMFLTSLLDKMYQKSDIWIGMKYNDINQTYRWLDGSIVQYTNWINKDPDPRRGKYVKVGLEEGARNFLFWKPANENETLPFFCEKLQANQTTKRPPTPVARNGPCPSGWFKYKQNCYHFNTQRLSFVEADAACQSHGYRSHLASILSLEENRNVFLASERRSLVGPNATALSNFVWLGLTNEPFVRGFSWTDGKPLAFVNWYTNVPYPLNRHLCAGFNSGGKWQDEPCYLKFPSICKRPLGDTEPTVYPTAYPTGSGVCNGYGYGWIYYNGSCYYFSSRYTTADYHNAKNYCNRKSAQLVSIRDAAENEFVRSQLRRSNYYYYYYYNTDEAFIGLTDLTLEGQWAWDDGSVTNYLNFDTADNEPNNWHGMEDCVTITASNGTWSDRACNLRKRYVCKKTNGTTVKPTNYTILPDTGYCGQGWKLYGSKCYLIRYGTGNHLNFEAAQNYCQGEGGNLVSIHKSNENAFLLSQLHDVGGYMLIGLTDSMYEGTYLWTDQSSVDYTNWYRYYYYGSTTDCVHFHGFNGKWLNRDCKTETGFICQKSSSKSPPTTTSPVEDDPEPCPTGYTKFMKSCYKFNSNPSTYEEALRECRKETEGETGDLVSLHNTYEQAFVFSQFARNASSSWIGLRKSRADNNFKWSDSSFFDYSNWRYSYYRYYRNDQCVRSTTDGKWEATGCMSKSPFTCKITRKFDDEHLSFIGNCTEGWSKINDKCYKYFSNSKPWAAARESCKGFGGNLATVTSAKLELKINGLVGSLYSDVWIGLNDRAKELYFQWSSGLPLPPDGYTNWAPGEPDDNSGKENCVEINTRTLYWDDVSCNNYNAYVCEHPLECHNALGMEDESIPDESITATSNIEDYFPWYARVNKTRSNYLGAAWCTNITSGDQSLTISLGEVMQITRISTQGLRNYTRPYYWGYYYGYTDLYVMSYVLEYSNDGTNWIQYIRDGDYGKNAVVMPGNVDGDKVEGTTVDIQAAYLRFTPKRFKNTICMRVELYGCKSICRRALGMENYGIKKEQITLSSVSSDSKVAYIRPNVNGNYWCAKDRDTNPFININLLRTTKVTRITAISNDTALKFRLLYSSDGITFAMVETHTNEERIFSAGTHDLEKPVTAQYIKISPFNLGVEKVCLQVELYGCLSDCNTALGMSSKTIKDNYINASTALANNPASDARLNTGSYNNNSWCASRIDTSQYLEVDFQQPAHITEIAVQGHNGDIEKYVKKYIVQWSNDFNFWHHVPEELPGNTNGYGIERRKLKVPIEARYIRINPSKWKNGICMRVEFYGCSLSYGPPISKDKWNLYNASIRLMNETFVEALQYSNSSEFKYLSSRVEKEITKLYMSIETFRYGFHSVKVNEFRNGSVIVDLTIKSNSRGDVLELLIANVKFGRIGSFMVDERFPVTYIQPKPTSPSKSDKKTLSAGVIAGVTVSACVLGLLIGAAAIYCIKFRRGSTLFDHSSFDNSAQTIENFETT